MVELAQLFQDMAMMVEEQQEAIVKIEQNAQMAEKDMEQALVLIYIVVATWLIHLEQSCTSSGGQRIRQRRSGEAHLLFRHASTHRSRAGCCRRLPCPQEQATAWHTDRNQSRCSCYKHSDGDVHPIKRRSGICHANNVDRLFCVRLYPRHS